MFTRIVMLMLIVMLALPVATLMRSGDTTQRSWSNSAVAANGKHHKHHKKGKTGTRTIRQPITQTFASTAPIAMPAAPGQTIVQASPYPAAITVSGFPNGTITDVNLLLTDFTNSYVSDVDVLLSSDDGRRALVMSDIGDGFTATDDDLRLDDEAAAPLSRTAFSSGTFRPTDFNAGIDSFNAPAPAPNGSVALSTFDGTDPNGTWRLWVMEAAPTDDSDFGGGWALQITAEVDVQVPEPAQAKDKMHKKKDKGRR